MEPINHSTLCPVCGYDLGFEPWTEDSGASHEICPCCGIEFGYDDVTEASGTEGTREEIHLQWRNEWIKKGMIWNGFAGVIPPPPDWDPREQLRKIGVKEFR